MKDHFESWMHLEGYHFVEEYFELFRSRIEYQMIEWYQSIGHIP